MKREKVKQLVSRSCSNMYYSKRTVDSNGKALRQDEAVSANKGRNLAELVQLEVLGRRAGRVGKDNLDVEVVGLGDGQNGRRPRVGLTRGMSVSTGLETGRLCLWHKQLTSKV